MPLTEIQVKKANQSIKQVALFDTGGLHLLITPKGAKLWRLKFQFDKKSCLMSLGKYPEVGLKEARSKRDEARLLIAKGINPIEHKTEKQAQEATAKSNTFQVLAEEWLQKTEAPRSPVYHRGIQKILENDVFPFLGKLPIKEIKAREVLAVLRTMEERNAVSVAVKARQIISQVFRYAIILDKSDTDPTIGLGGALSEIERKNYATILDSKKIGELLRAIEAYTGNPTVTLGLKLLPLTFVRSTELRCALWSEFDLESATWVIPAERMKMKSRHIVPLSKQALEILQDLKKHTGDKKHVFPALSAHKDTASLSEAAFIAALRRLGYSPEEMTIHGFRSMASTLLNEQGFHPDLIELQLAHKERNKVRAAYNKAERLQERREMMQAWADHLDQLKASKPNGGR